MKTFRGYWPKDGGAMVTVDYGDGNGERMLDPRNDLVNHSPDGFMWGYSGSGPSQLALAICTNVFDDAEACGIYQLYKEKIIAGLTRGCDWEFTEEDVRMDVAKIREREARKNG